MPRSSQSNIYHQILKIPARITEPNAYQLLGVEPFESDVNTIRQAAMDRNSLLQRKQNAENYDHVKRIEREVGQALVLLTNPQRKAEYDRQLANRAPKKSPPPLRNVPPLEAPTRSAANPEDDTVEVTILPDDVPLPPLPNETGSPSQSEVRTFPAPAAINPQAARRQRANANPDANGEALPIIETEDGPNSPPKPAWQPGQRAVISVAIGLLLVLGVWGSYAFFTSPSNTAQRQKENADPPQLPQSNPEPKPETIGLLTVDDLRTRVLVQPTLDGLGDFSVASDGSWFAMLSQTGTVQVWEKSTGNVRTLAAPDSDQTTVVYTCLAATPNGQYLYAGTSEGSLAGWAMPLTDLNPKRHTSAAFAKNLRSLKVTGDNLQVVGINGKSDVIRFDRKTTRAMTKRFPVSNVQALNGIIAHPESDRVAVLGTDQKFWGWPTADRLSQLKTFLDRTKQSPPLAAAYAPHLPLFADAGADHQIQITNLDDAQAKPVVCFGHQDRVGSLCFSPDGQTLVSGAADCSVRLWDVETGGEMAKLGGHQQPILAVAFAQDGKTFYSASLDGLVREWSLNPNAALPPPIKPPPSSDPVKTRITAGNISRLNVAGQFTIPAATGFGASQNVVLSSNGSFIARKDDSQTVGIYETKTGQLLHSLPVKMNGESAARFTPDGKTLVVLCGQNSIKSWDVLTGRLVENTSLAEANPFKQSLAFATSSDRFASVEKPREIQIHSTNKPIARILHTFSTKANIEEVTLTPDGRFLGIRYRYQVEVWDLGTGQTIKPVLRSRIDAQTLISTISFQLSPDGKLCVMGFHDGKVHIHDARDGTELASFTAHDADVLRIAFSSQGDLLWTSGRAEEEVRAWQTSDWTPIARLGTSAQSSQSLLSVQKNLDPVVTFQLTDDGGQLVVLHESGKGKIWEVGNTENPNLAINSVPNDLAISGPAQVITRNNASMIQKWTESFAHANIITHIQFSVDGKYLITAGSDGMLRCWDGQTAKLYHQIALNPQTATAPSPVPITTPFGRPIGSGSSFSRPGNPNVSSSPINVKQITVSSGNLLAAATGDDTIKLWNIATGASLGTIADNTVAHPWFGFTPDGNTLIVQAGSRAFQYWKVETRKRDNMITLHEDVLAAAISPKPGPYPFALALKNGEVLVLSESGKSNKKLSNTNGPLSQLKHSSDGKQLTGRSASGNLEIWETETQASLRNVKSSSATSDMVLTSDNLALLLGQTDGKLQVLRVSQTGGEVAPVEKSSRGHLLAISPDGKLLLSAGEKRGRLEFWGVGEKPSELDPARHTQTPLASTPQGPSLHPEAITKDHLKEIIELAKFPAHKGTVWAMEFTGDGNAFLTGGTDRMAHVWDATSHKKLMTLSGHTNRIMAVAASPDNRFLATGSNEGVIKLWDRNTGQELRHRTGHPQSVLDLAFSPNGMYLASASLDKSLKVWNADTLTEQKQLTGHTSSVSSVTWLTDTELVSGSRDRRVRLWDPLGKSKGDRTGIGGDIDGIASTPDRKIAIVSSNNAIGLWNTSLDPDEWLRLRGHRDAVNGVAFSPDQLLVASVSKDLTLKLWDAQTGELLHSISASENPIHCLAFSPDGRWIITGSADGEVKVWGRPAK